MENYNFFCLFPSLKELILKKKNIDLGDQKIKIENKEIKKKLEYKRIIIVRKMLKMAQTLHRTQKYHIVDFTQFIIKLINWGGWQPNERKYRKNKIPTPYILKALVIKPLSKTIGFNRNQWSFYTLSTKKKRLYFLSNGLL